MKPNNTKITLTMNELDNKILELFRYLINSGIKHLRSINYEKHTLLYIVNCKEITLRLGQYIKGRMEVKPNTYSTIDSVFDFPRFGIFSWSFEFAKTNESEVGYELTIEGKTYTVPKLQRAEQAHVLDKIEATLKERESDILNSILYELTSESCEEF